MSDDLIEKFRSPGCTYDTAIKAADRIAALTSLLRELRDECESQRVSLPVSLIDDVNAAVRNKP